MTETIVSMNFEGYQYHAHYGLDLLHSFDFRALRASQFHLFTQNELVPLYAGELRARLIREGMLCDMAILPQGEDGKSLQSLDRGWKSLIRCGADADTVILALGGGVIGDVSGMVAASYHRGIRWVCLPTTLLAMVDSSVGGKVAINIESDDVLIKNAVGLYHPPIAIVADTSTLGSLAPYHWRDGLVEMLKCAVVAHTKLFYACIDATTTLEDFRSYVPLAAQIKSWFVVNDPRDKGCRLALNYGHTFGHAFESLLNLSHGAAIALGMALEGWLAAQFRGFPIDALKRQNQVLAGWGLPTRFKGDPHQVLSLIAQDKKVKNGELHFSLPNALGNHQPPYTTVVSEDAVLQCLDNSSSGELEKMIGL